VADDNGLINPHRVAAGGYASLVVRCYLSTDPRQAGLAPASYRLAMSVGILVAFKAFQNIEAIGLAVFRRQLGGVA